MCGVVGLGTVIAMACRRSALWARSPERMQLFRSVASFLATDAGRFRFVVHASCLAIVPSLLVFGVLVALGIDTLRVPPGALDPALVLYSVLLAPAIETALMLALAAVLARLVPEQAALQAVLIALFTALTHGMWGNWGQVMRTIWPILVYAMSLVLWLRRSVSDAFIVTAIVHAFYNVAFFAVGILGALAPAGE